MYDPITSNLIAGIPQMEEFDAQTLSSLLSETYIQISLLRLRIIENDEEQAIEAPRDENLDALVGRLRALAVCLELHTCLSPNSPDRSSAAFVSATAHSFILAAREALGDARLDRLFVSAKSISQDISAALLFVSAGYPADAMEVIKGTISLPLRDPRRPLVRAVRSLASGRLREIANLAIRIPENIDVEVHAELLLWSRLLETIKLMANRLLENRTPAGPVWERINQELEGVRADALQEVDIPGGNQPRTYSSFAGPHHLATLLLATGRRLQESGVVITPPPEGTPFESWRNFIEARAEEKPYLWTNHREAIELGMLERGTSAVISYPTGAGKSTLSELKAAATILQGEKVVYIVPTLALQSQVSIRMADLLPAHEVTDSPFDDNIFAGLDEPLRGEAWVMTPERCLLLMGLFPDRFTEVGLVVFDECHLVHCDPNGEDPRNLDAMLCLLKLLDLAPESDVLMMSAMMRNNAEIVDWLKVTFGKTTLSFDLAWKPTRQVRASLIFDFAEIGALRTIVNTAAQEGRNIPQSRLVARPFALACLKQTWETNRLADYRILPLINDTVKLSATRARRYPKLESRSAAASIAYQAAKQGLKTIVFIHNPSSVRPAMAEVDEMIGYMIEFTEQEDLMLVGAAFELGGDEYVIKPNGMAGGHYGGLLPLERAVMESCFKRDDGIEILFSTNTLAQGMNLPADQVIIVRTGSYDAGSQEYRQLEAHELLNAAGRAGRAGHAANGLVLVIPDNVVTFNTLGGRPVIGQNIDHLKNDILARDDRCLDICDPIEVLLSKCMTATPLDHATLNSMLVRLPLGDEEADRHESARRFLAKSFAKRRADLNNRLGEYETMVSRALVLRDQLLPEEVPPSTQTICVATGLNPSLVTSLLERLEDEDFRPEISLHAWLKWCLDWLYNNREETSRNLLPTALTKEALLTCLECWVDGNPLVRIELLLGTRPDKLSSLKAARKFIRREVRDTSYCLGLIAQIAKSAELPMSDEIVYFAAKAAVLTRDGVNSFEKLVILERNRANYWTRAKVEAESERLLEGAPPQRIEFETYAQCRRRIIRTLRDAELAATK